MIAVLSSPISIAQPLSEVIKPRSSSSSKKTIPLISISSSTSLPGPSCLITHRLTKLTTSRSTYQQFKTNMFTLRINRRHGSLIWMTKEIAVLIRRKHLLFKKAPLNPTHLNQAHQARTKVKHLIHISLNDYLQQLGAKATCQSKLLGMFSL